MNTLSPHLVLATVLVARHLSFIRTSAAAQASAGDAPSIGLVVAILVVVFLAAMIRAARAMASLMSQFLRVATEMTSVLFTLTLVMVVAVALLGHH